MAFAPDGQVRRAFVLSHNVGDDTVVATEVFVEDTVDRVNIGIVGRPAVFDHSFFTGLVILVVPVEILDHTSGINLKREREK